MFECVSMFLFYEKILNIHLFERGIIFIYTFLPNNMSSSYCVDASGQTTGQPDAVVDSEWLRFLPFSLLLFLLRVSSACQVYFISKYVLWRERKKTLKDTSNMASSNLHVSLEVEICSYREVKHEYL